MSKHVLIRSMEECVQLCEQLLDCLSQEKAAMLRFDMELLLENNSKKEETLHLLVEKRKGVQAYIQERYTDISKVAEALDEPDRSQWIAVHEHWTRVWEQMHANCRRNKGFIEQSQENLDALTHHLKGLFSQGSVYEKSGKMEAAQTEGQVVEASY